MADTSARETTGSLKKQLSWMGKKFKSQDTHGSESIGFKVNGEGQFKTYLGALLSLLSLIVLTSYAVQRFIVMQEFLGTRHLDTVEIDFNREKMYS